MKKNVTYALDYALNKGFQIHPDALEILEDLDVKDLKDVIKQIIREKIREKRYLISQEDLESFLGIKEDSSLENEHRILFDPTSKITSAEGIDGFNSLFSSRFSKLKKIISNRPEAKLLKSIKLVMTTKSDNDVYVCGLVFERNSDRNVTRLKIDDSTGSIETIVFDKDLQKIANQLLQDQFVMLKVRLGKKWRVYCKGYYFA